MTSLSPCPIASAQPAATRSAMPATTNRLRYGARNGQNRATVWNTGRRGAVSAAVEELMTGPEAVGGHCIWRCPAPDATHRAKRIDAVEFQAHAPVAQWIEQPPPKGQV